MLSDSITARIDDLQLRYTLALDTKDMQAWLTCFSENGGYLCTTAENEASSLPVAIMMDDGPNRLKDRVKFIEKVWAGTFEDYSTRHLVQRISIEKGDGIILAHTNFIVSYSADGGPTQLLAAGIYRDEVEIAGERALFRRKTAIIDSSVTPRYLVYPL